MEILDIVNKYGEPTGLTIEREIAHQEGIRHRTSHVWIMRKKDNKADKKDNKKDTRYEILLQKRSANKDSYPDCYDISSAGHIPAGVDFVTSALRELKEELGLTVNADELKYCGQRQFVNRSIFNDKPYWDSQISNVYLLFKDVDIDSLTLQESEVASVKWFDFDELFTLIEQKAIKSCISLDELNIIKDYINR